MLIRWRFHYCLATRRSKDLEKCKYFHQTRENPFHMSRQWTTSSFLFISYPKIRVEELFRMFGILLRQQRERKEETKLCSKVFFFAFCWLFKRRCRKRWKNVIFHHIRPIVGMGESALINYSRRVSITREKTKGPGQLMPLEDRMKRKGARTS